MSSDDENDRTFTSGDGADDETLNQRTGAADRRSSTVSRNRHNNRGASENRFDANERRRENDFDEVDGNDGTSDDNESTSFTRRRNQNRRRPVKNNDGDSDEVDERDGNYRPDEDEDKLDRRRDSTDDDSYDDDDEENDSRVSSHSTSSRRNNNRNRGFNRNYPQRRRHQGYRGDVESNLQKPYAKRPNYSDLSSKPYPKDNTPQSTRRVKNHKKPYSAPRPAGFPNINSPSNGADATPFGPVNANTQFIALSGESPDDLINLEDGATILDTHTGQTYELSIADSRSSPIISYPSESADRVPFAPVKSNYGRPAGASLDSLLQTLLIRSNQPGLAIVEPVSA